MGWPARVCMMKERVLSNHGSLLVTHFEEDGKSITGHHQDIDPVMNHVRKVRDMHSTATKRSNPNGWQHIGSVPIAIIVDWCKRNGYTFHQFAVNEDKAKDKFMSYFLSRDFSKLHNRHVTTKPEKSVFTVPKDLARRAHSGVVSALSGLVKKPSPQMRNSKDDGGGSRIVLPDGFKI